MCSGTASARMAKASLCDARIFSCRTITVPSEEMYGQGAVLPPDTFRFSRSATNSLLEWLRPPGDIVFIVGGTLPVLYLCWLGVRYMKVQTNREASNGVLFTEIVESKRSGA